MDKLLFDTNVILDMLQNRKEHLAASLGAIAHAQSGKALGAVTAISLSDISYVCRERSSASLRLAFSTLRRHLGIATLSEAGVDRAITSKLADFEDALQWEAAIEWGASHFLTRNLDDFPTDGAIKALTPREYLLQASNED